MLVLSSALIRYMFLIIMGIIPIFAADQDSPAGTISEDALIKRASELRFKSMWSAEDIVELNKLLTEDETKIFFYATIALVMHQDQTSSANQTLVTEYKKSAGNRRAFAAAAINRLPILHNEILGYIRELLNSDVTDDRIVGCEDLSSAPELYKKLSPEVEKLLMNEKDLHAKMVYIMQLSKAIKKNPTQISAERILELLQKGLLDPAKEARLVAVANAGILYTIYPDKQESFREILYDGLKDKNLWVSSAALVQIKKLNLEASNSAEIIRDSILSNEEDLIRGIMKHGPKLMNGEAEFNLFLEGVKKGTSGDQLEMINRLAEETKAAK